MDHDRRSRTASDESVKLPAGQRAAALVERGGARAIRRRTRRRKRIGGGVRPVQDYGDVRRIGGREFSSEGSEFAGGGYGWNIFEWEG